MTTGCELIFGAYEQEADGVLHLVTTGQRLIPISISGSQCAFRYTDREIGLDFQCELITEPYQIGRPYINELQLDWRKSPYAPIRQSYGLWRRISWFLLDALLVWLEVTKQDQEAVMLRSGWLNGKWRENVRLRSSMMRNCGKHRDHLAEPIAPFDIFPLNVPAPRWRYHEGLPGALEGRIATQTLADGTRIADLTILAEVQLQDIPRFSSEDGTIFFFHRVEPNVGPEYAPIMTY